MKTIILVTRHPFCSRQDDKARLNSHKNEPVKDYQVDQVEEQQHDEGIEEKLQKLGLPA